MYASDTPLSRPLTLPCGAVLRNRLVKSAMSDSLGDGCGNPGPDQSALYALWAAGGVAASIIGEVQGDPFAAEKPGNLVLHEGSDLASLRRLTEAATGDGAHLWAQLGHAGAMAHPPIGVPRGPSALELPELRCAELSPSEIKALPDLFKTTAVRAKAAGFTGVQIHAAHGFLLGQFLSPLFNRRGDSYGGALVNRMRLLREVIDAVREGVGPSFPVAMKINATDQLDGGFTEDEALSVLAALSNAKLDLIDISGGTYFPGATSASDRTSQGAYFQAFAQAARSHTDTPLMITGGIKRRAQAVEAIVTGAADVVGLARALILAPDLPRRWAATPDWNPTFPRFDAPPEGGITAWYTMRMAQLAAGRQDDAPRPLPEAVAAYDARDAARVARWHARFGAPPLQPSD